MTVRPADEDDESARPVGPVVAVVPARSPHPLLALVDLALGAGAAAVSIAGRAVDVTAVVARPVGGLVLRPPLVPRAWTPDAFLKRLERRGESTRTAARGDVDELSRELVPALTDAVLDRIDLTELVLSRVDLVRVVEGVLDRLDLTELVLERVDIDRVIAAADLDAAAAQLDVDAVAARLDVDAVAARLDVDAVAAKLDLVGIATYVVDAIDLPEIIRTSTGSVATEAVRGVRMQSVDADAQVQSLVDRALLRRRSRRTAAPEDNGGESQ